MTLSEDKGGFCGKSLMPDDAKADLDALVQKLKAEPNGAYIEIEGHTDNAGAKDLNYKLGLERAESVKRYLYEQHQVPLHKINVISYGEEKPIAPNNTKAGRAQNRRVVIKVLTWLASRRGFASVTRIREAGAMDRERWRYRRNSPAASAAKRQHFRGASRSARSTNLRSRLRNHTRELRLRKPQLPTTRKPALRSDPDPDLKCTDLCLSSP